jgi:hypothetical protein
MYLLKIVKRDLWFLPFVAREMQGRWKGEGRDKQVQSQILAKILNLFKYNITIQI